ncbi:hypothetical protein Cni_G03546 [Canna indica]|uniref:Uncharacterized protein n=1 Tax=Canna indica TaxID=4628 RepID=A0AAQ3JU37_9LILI|nr:hypothetical protein Cni_G03546 [Canna indica]
MRTRKGIERRKDSISQAVIDAVGCRRLEFEIDEVDDVVPMTQVARWQLHRRRALHRKEAFVSCVIIEGRRTRRRGERREKIAAAAAVVIRAQDVRRRLFGCAAAVIFRQERGIAHRPRLHRAQLTVATMAILVLRRWFQQHRLAQEQAAANAVLVLRRQVTAPAVDASAVIRRGVGGRRLVRPEALVLAAPANGNVAERAALRPVPATGPAVVPRLQLAVVVVVAKLGVRGIAPRAAQRRRRRRLLHLLPLLLVFPLQKQNQTPRLRPKRQRITNNTQNTKAGTAPASTPSSRPWRFGNRTSDLEKGGWRKGKKEESNDFWA